MKYVLYRFPDVVKPTELDEDGKPNYNFELKDGVDEKSIKPELIAVEFGDDISVVTRELMQDVIDDLSGSQEYSRCKCTSTIPEEPNNLEYLSGNFDYEMRGIVADLSKPFNTIIYFGVLEKEEEERKITAVPFVGSISC